MRTLQNGSYYGEIRVTEITDLYPFGVEEKENMLLVINTVYGCYMLAWK